MESRLEDFQTNYAFERTFGQTMPFEGHNSCMKKLLENAFARQTLPFLGAKLCSVPQLGSPVGHIHVGQHLRISRASPFK